MIKHYYCISCDYPFTVVIAGVEPSTCCPLCHSGKNTTKNPLRYNNLVSGLKEKSISKQKMVEGGRGGKVSTPSKTRDNLGKKAKVSGRTYSKGIKIKENNKKMENVKI